MVEKISWYPLSYPQRGIWHLERLYPQTGIGNIAATLKINSKLDFVALNQAVNQFIKMNDALRIRVRENDDGEPEQYVSAFTYRDFQLMDFSQKDIRMLYEWDAQMTQAPLYQPDADLFYFSLLKIDDETGGFYVKLHHLIGDAWTLVGLGNEIVRYYKAIVNGEELSDEKKPSYIDYVISEQNYLDSERFLKDQVYWLDKFSKIPQLTTLKERKPGNKSIKTNRKTFLLPAKLCGKIREHCTLYRTSIFSLFFGALAMYMNRTRGESEIVFGTPVLNRSNAKEKETMGMFISTVPIRIKVDDTQDYISFSKTINKEWMSVLRHQKYPYTLLLQKLREKSPGLEKLYDIVISYQNAKFMKEDKNSQQGRWHQNGCQADLLSIHINDREDDGNIVVDYDYLLELFYEKEIEFLHDHVIRLLWHAIDNPSKMLPLIEMISEAEKKKILHDFNETAMDYPRDKTVVDLFVEQVNKTPDHICCLTNEGQITYKQLNKKANQIAGYFREKGIKPDDIIGIRMHRSIDLIVAILAVLKAGGAYLPIDYDLPNERIHMILEDCNPRVLITDMDLDGIKTPCEIIRFDSIAVSKYDNRDIPAICKQENLIYVIYTSGSTGKPKGVMVEHRNVVNLISSIGKKIDYRNKTVLSKTSVSFDVFVLDSLLPIVYGAKIILTDNVEQKNSYRINDLIIKHHVNMIHSVPSRLKDMLIQNNSKEAFECLTDITTGGEMLTGELLKRIKSICHANVYNVYGPTETTVYSTFCNVTDKKAVTIGKPIGNTRVYILDKHMNVLPIGVPGELCISGDGVARGYLHRDKLTEESFVRSPFDKGQRMYKTGDIARWYPEGEIEYIGRRDSQVKIRGFRIELGEVEKEILQYKGISEAIVIDRQESDGKKYLCAYILCDNEVSTSNLKGFLSGRLPQYMIPPYFIRIDKVPLTPNGKIDKYRLPAVDRNKIAKIKYKKPQTDTERTMVPMWQEILKIEEIGRDSNFFELGGDSLNVVILQNRIYKKYHIEIPVDKIYNIPTIMELSQYIDIVQTKRYIPIPKAELDAYYPLSPAQKRVYLSAGLEKDHPHYNTPFALSLDGDIHCGKVEEIFQKLIQRHDALRTSFHIQNGKPVQKVHDEVKFSVDSIRLAETEMITDTLLRGLVRPFDLKRAPLLRVVFIERTDSKKILFIDTHHIICDGISMDILLGEFLAMYEGKSFNKTSIRYIDYAIWRNGLFVHEDMARQEKYWLDVYKNKTSAPNMPLDFDRPEVQTYAGKRLDFKIDNELFQKIKNIKKSDGMTPFVFFLAAYNILLAKYTDQDDIVVGTATSGRNHPDLEKLVGMFVNTIALRNKPEGSKNFHEFLYEVRDNVLEAFHNQDYPFEKLVGKLKLSGGINRNPLFDTMLTCRRMDKERKCRDLTISQYPFDYGTSKFDISVEITEQRNAYDMAIEYCTDLYTEETMNRMGNHLLYILNQVLADTSIKISDIDLLADDEKEFILHTFNDTAVDYQKEKPIHQLFEEQVKKTPDAIAMIFEDHEYTYRHLNQTANQLAWYLRKKGVRANDIVGIMMKRSFSFIAAIMGVLKSGGCYLPIDPDYPEERVAYILKDSQAKLILTEAQYTGRLNDEIEAIDMREIPVADFSEENPPVINSGTDLSYVIYTSGSTGVPKGVMLRHDSLVNLERGVSHLVQMRMGRRMVSLTTVSFDIFIFETLLPLANGMTVIMADEEQQLSPALQAILFQKQRIDFMQTTPSRMAMILDSEYNQTILKNLKDIVLGGEVFTKELYNRIRRYTKANLYNGYGPSETTVYSTMKKIDGAEGVNIGKPLSNTQIYIVDRERKPVPVGVEGELFIGGAGVGNGYINHVELTDARFFPNPITGEGRVYKTGDLAKWLPNGEIHYIGRKDHQIKLRGLRIEPGEIENGLLSYPGIEKAVVMLRGEDESKQLCAYVVCRQMPDLAELRAFLSKKLPVYMIPSFFIKLDALPLTPNGKVDRTALLKEGTILQSLSCLPMKQNPCFYVLGKKSFMRSRLVYMIISLH